MKFTRSLSVGVSALALLLASSAFAQGSGPVKRVLLISVDGMHAVDFLNCAQGVSTVNGGKPFCPSIAALGTTGINYVAASTSKPSDSFPGLTSIITGGSPALTGVYYDVAYSRALDGPAVVTGNGNGPGPCTAGAPPTGFTTEYEEGIDIDKTKVNGGAPGAIPHRRWHPLDRPAETGSRPGPGMPADLAVAIRSRQQHLQRDSRCRRIRSLVRQAPGLLFRRLGHRTQRTG